MKTDRFFRALLVLTAFLHVTVACPGAQPEPDETQSTTNISEAIRMAAEHHSPVFLEFEADWCAACKAMQAITLNDRNVKERLGSFVALQIDIDAQPEIAKQYEVSSVPTYIILGSSGDEVERTSGLVPPLRFSEWLNAGLSLAAFSAARKAIFEEEQKTLAAQLRNPDPAVRMQLIGRLFEYRFRKEAYYQNFASKHLKSASDESPQLFLSYLNHDRLAVRILAGNLLRAKLGDGFAFDPWAKPADRLAVVETWRKKLEQNAASNVSE